jgi:hypothetical protein
MRTDQTQKAGRAGAIVLCMFVAMLFNGCRGQSEEDAVAGVFADMAARVERRDADGLIGHLDADYADFEGRDRAATREMAEEYFRRYRGIKAKLLSSRVSLGEAGTAAAEVDVALYSGVASALRKAVGFDGENYRVTCRLRKSDRWRLSEASWEYVPVSGLFPESLQVLRELFPDA